MKDPAPYKNGLCRCGCRRKVPPFAQEQGDPWATVECCHSFHGVEIGPTDMELQRERRGRHERRRREEQAA